MNHRIFIVEDDRVIAQAVKRHIESWGCEARVVTDFRNVLKEFVAFDAHLVLMDISLPFFNGYHWCREIRKISKVPVIFISSASDNMNIVMAMDMGGDDFIAKPFDLQVLTAKVQAVLRRAYEFSGAQPLLEHRGAILNLADASLTYDGRRLELTKNDFRILQTLMEHPGEVVSRETHDAAPVGDGLLRGRQHAHGLRGAPAQKAGGRRAGRILSSPARAAGYQLGG